MRPRLLPLAGVLVLGSGCAQDRTDQLPEASALYRWVFLIAVAVFLLAGAVIVYSALTYRSHSGDDDLPPPIHGNLLVEVAWTFVPLIVTLVILFLAWQTLMGID